MNNIRTAKFYYWKHKLTFSTKILICYTVEELYFFLILQNLFRQNSQSSQDVQYFVLNMIYRHLLGWVCREVLEVEVYISHSVHHHLTQAEHCSAILKIHTGLYTPARWFSNVFSQRLAALLILIQYL